MSSQIFPNSQQNNPHFPHTVAHQHKQHDNTQPNNPKNADHQHSENYMPINHIDNLNNLNENMVYCATSDFIMQ